MLPIRKVGLQGISIHIHRLHDTLVVPIPPDIRVIRLEYQLPPTIIDPEIHLHDPKTIDLQNGVLPKTPRRKCIRHIQQRIHLRRHRMTGRIRTAKLVRRHQTDLERIRLLILMYHRIRGILESRIPIPERPGIPDRTDRRIREYRRRIRRRRRRSKGKVSRRIDIDRNGQRSVGKSYYRCSDPPHAASRYKSRFQYKHASDSRR